VSKENSLDKYFVGKKENNILMKKRHMENENIITQSNTVASQLDHSTVNNTSTSDIHSIDSKTLTINNNSELTLSSTSNKDTIETISIIDSITLLVVSTCDPDKSIRPPGVKNIAIYTILIDIYEGVS